MHIVDGALANSVVIAGTLLAVGGIGLGLRKLALEQIPIAGILSATFFVGSLIHVPVGPTSVHLILNGLAGIVLGWAAFPALFVGLLLQAVFFGFGGVTVLGINTLNIALPAVLVWFICGSQLRTATPRMAAVYGAVAGALAIALTTGVVAISLSLSGDEFLPAAKLVFFAHIPIMVLEAALTGAAVYLIAKVKPELFSAMTGIDR